VREHLGHEARDIAKARQRLVTDGENIDASIAAMLDNISADTRDLIEERIAVLRKQREGQKARSADLAQLSLREAEVQDMVHEVGAFISGVELTLQTDVNDIRAATIRRCVALIEARTDQSNTLWLYPLPFGVSTRVTAIWVDL